VHEVDVITEHRHVMASSVNCRSVVNQSITLFAHKHK